MADDIVLEEESGLEESGDVTPTIYPEEVDITVGEVTIEHDSVTYEVDAGELPAEASTTAGVAKSPAGSLYPSYGSPVDERTIGITAVEVTNGGTGYVVNDKIMIEDSAELKVTAVSAGTSTNFFGVTAATPETGYLDDHDVFVPSDDPQYAMSGYAANETITIRVSGASDVSPVVTITSVDANGAITGVSITNAGSIEGDPSEPGDTITFDMKLDGSNMIYSGLGQKGFLHLTLSRIVEGAGAITEISIVEPGDFEVYEPVPLTDSVEVTDGTGSGAVLSITLNYLEEEESGSQD